MSEIPKRNLVEADLEAFGQAMALTRLVDHEHAVAKALWEAAKIELSNGCTCDEAYTSRRMTDPMCKYCDLCDLREAMKQVEASGWTL